MRFFVTRNPTFNSLTLDPQNPGPWRARISELSLRQDVNRTDLTAFARNGGKILMAHGTSDQLVSTRATAEYYERVRRDMGRARRSASCATTKSPATATPPAPCSTPPGIR